MISYWGHYLQSVCSSAGSFDLPLSVIASSIEEVGTAAELVESETASSRINAAVKDSGGTYVDGKEQLFCFLIKILRFNVCVQNQHLKPQRG